MDYQQRSDGGINPVSAMLVPFPRNKEAHATDDYEAHLLVTLPVFRLFSPKARAETIAHEFAHAIRTLKFGRGWHEKMQSRYAVEERLADALAIRWRFAESIKNRYRERN